MCQSALVVLNALRRALCCFQYCTLHTVIGQIGTVHFLLSYSDLSYYNSSSVCVFVCSLSPPRSFGGSSPNLVGVCTWTSHLPLKDSFSKRSMGRRVNGSLSLSTILFIRQPHATHCKRPLLLCCCLLQSLIRCLLLHCISTGAGCM